ncbi:MAG: Type 1 glutamine amidotransferase-like domain-containing protein [Anaerolineae bacterium]|nr:Type 1 glutamine amidotransferase-like domain-containing protein [Anaerolineae bacterium]
MTTGKLLLTSSGITNDSIHKALVDLLGKPINESSALFVPLAIYAYPQGIAHMWEVVKGWGDLGWKSLGLLELTALSSLPEEIWRPQLEATDAIIVGGGNKFYLSYWMEKSGLFGMLPQLLEQGKVYVGASAGSLMMTSGLNFDQNRLQETSVYFDDQFNEEMSSSAGSARTLGLVEFGIRPHLNADYFPQAKLENVEKWALKTGKPLYALDDQSALKIVDGKVEVISNGEWKLFVNS